MQKQPLVFMADGELIQTEVFADTYPLKQTQALILTLEELSTWVEQARSVFGEQKVRVLDQHFEWIDMVDNLVEDIYSAIEDDEDRDVIRCRLDAEAPLVEEIEVVLDNSPKEEDVIEGSRNEALGAVLASLADFWVEQLRLRVIRLQSILMNDGEVLAVIKRQQLLANIHF